MAAALTVTDELALPLRAVGDLAAAAEVSREEVVVITQCVSLGGKFPFDDASVGAVLSVIKKVESLGDQLIAEISRVLKAGGTVLVQSFTPSSNQKVTYLNWFWSMCSSFPLKKTTKALPKIQIDDDTELIDEDSLLTEDLKKPQLPVVGDQVGATRKACKNCTCGRAQGRTHRVCRVGHGIPWGPAGSRAQYQRAPADGSPADCRTRCLDPTATIHKSSTMTHTKPWSKRRTMSTTVKIWTSRPRLTVVSLWAGLVGFFRFGVFLPLLLFNFSLCAIDVNFGIHAHI